MHEFVKEQQALEKDERQWKRLKDKPSVREKPAKLKEKLSVKERAGKLKE